MNTWILEPRDPLIARDGRPFRADPGARARTLPFPLPSTIAGAFRSRAGGDPFDVAKIPALKKEAVHGPWLVELHENDEVRELYLPQPADIAYELVSAEDAANAEVKLHRLVPIKLPSNCSTNLPPELRYPMGLVKPFDGKPPRVPAFFRWSFFSKWLAKTDVTSFTKVKSDLGLSLERDTRFHVAIENDRRTAREHALFLTEGLCFEYLNDYLKRRLALLVRTSLPLTPGIGRVGGEGRLAAFRETSFPFPSPPPAIVADVVKRRACRLVLVTPAIFPSGYLPDLTRLPGARAEILAASVPSHGTVSGFDLAKNDGKGQPKPTRRFVPAGAVYFVRFDDTDEAAIREWVNAVWFKSVCDATDANDGWGIAVVGCWDGNAVSMTEETQ